MIETLRSIKNSLVPEETSYRRIPFGIARGCMLPINFRSQFRVYFGLYEREIRRIVKSYVHSGDRCYDIGAADGYYSLALSKMAAPGWVCCAEAEQTLAEQLEKTIRLNQHVGSRIIVLNSIIGDVADGAARRETLDHLVFDVGLEPPDFIKVDIEGAEFAFLRGAERAISQFSPKMIIEVHSHLLERQCAAFLEQRGYRCRIVPQATRFREHRPIAHNQWLCALRE